MPMKSEWNKTPEELTHDAIMLSAMLEGLEILIDDNSDEGRNAASALIPVLADRSSDLAAALSELFPPMAVKHSTRDESTEAAQ